jgi:protein-S-isoprenylcysteine O-methyltransferase Ste14
MIPAGLIYVAHGVFYSVFLLRLLPRGQDPPPAAAPSAAAPRAAPRSRGLLAFHTASFGVLYFGIGEAVFSPRPGRGLWPPQPVPGAALTLMGAIVVAWALLVFRSWRLLARIDTGHQLCTEGPFRLVRHPIYLSVDLLALGSVLWIPRPVVLLGALLVVVAGDLRARAEEKVLAETFGEEYRRYASTVKRYLPGVY